MPNQKKQSATLRIATVHSLIAGILAPAMGGFLLTFFHYYTLPMLSDTMYLVLGAGESVALTYIGVLLGATYINRKYRIVDVSSVVNLSTAYYVVLSGLWMSADMFFLSQFAAVPTIAMITVAIEAVLTIVVFYFASKKYIRTN
ncbi:MAG: hypothetical protein ACYCZ0_02725 [Minisyncoccota bacterium]